MVIKLVKITEKAFMVQVIALARLRGWLVYHTHDSRRSAAGFPDLVLVRGRRLIFAELKAEDGQLKLAQIEWVAALEVVQQGLRGNGVYTWRPSQWAEIEKVLE